MLEKIYGFVDFVAAAVLLFGGVPAPDILLYVCAFALGLKGFVSFVPVPVYMPGIMMCGTDIVASVLISFSVADAMVKTPLVIILLFKSLPSLILSMIGK